MDDQNRNLSPCRTQIHNLPTCLIREIFSRLGNRSLLSYRLICKRWYRIFSDPQLHPAPSSSTYLIRQTAPNRPTREDPEFTFVNSCNGLLCIVNARTRNRIYVCNPILGEYITIPTKTMRRMKSVLGFSSRSNQFKVLQFRLALPIPGHMAEIYTISTRQWRKIGIAPSCPNLTSDGSFSSFVNGSIHWADEKTHQIVYFNFDSEQFGSLPSPPEWRGSWPESTQVRMGVLNGCLSFYVCGGPSVPVKEMWIMKEYGVEESWSKIFSNTKLEAMSAYGAIHNPSFISLQDVAKGEQLTVLLRTRTTLSDFLLTEFDERIYFG